MSKQNPLSVWSYPYKKTYYLTHPWKWMKDLYWNMRNFIHRGRYGYAYVDVWNFCDWYPRVGAAALEYLALHKSGYPGVKPWDTPEAWEEYLHYLSKRLKRCADSQDICFGEERNEYAEEFHEAFKNLTYHEKHHDDGSVTTWRDETEEFKALRDKYFAREREIQKTDQEYIEQTYKWIGEDLGRLWD